MTNAGSEPLLFAIGAQACAWLGIARAPDWEEAILRLYRPCGSTCYTAVDAYARVDLVRLEPGEAHSVEWDGRAAETADVIRVCNPSDSWPRHHDDRCVGGRIAPVAPGRYRVSLLTYSGNSFVASRCGTSETCSVELDVVGIFSYPRRCEEPTAFTEFDIPETGDVVVPVMLGN